MKQDSKFSNLFDPRVFVTVTLIVVNLGVFAGVSISGGTDALFLLRFGAQYGPAIWEGEFWRLATTIFLHLDIFHLLFNIYALYVLGWFVEPFLGKRRYLSLYIFSGIFGSVLSVSVHPDYVSVGASGAIFGVAGAALAGEVLHSGTLRKGFSRPVAILLGIFILYNLAIGFIGVGIDNAAHIGGLIAGFILGYYYGARIEENERMLGFARILYLAFSALFALGVIYSIRPFLSARWCTWRAANLALLGKYDEAEKYYGRAVHLAPRTSRYHRQLGAFLISRKRPADAVREYEEALKVGGDAGELYYLSGVANLALGKPDDAYNYFKGAVKSGYFNAGTLVLLGNYYRLKRDFANARDAFVRAIRLEPNNPLPYQASLYLLTRPRAAFNTHALDFFTSETRTPHPRNSLYFTFVAAYNRHFRHFDDATKAYRTAIEKAPDNTFLHYDLAYCLGKIHRWNDAEREINILLASYPDIHFPGVLAETNIPLMLKLCFLKAQGLKNGAIGVRDEIERNYKEEIKHRRAVVYLNNLAYHYARQDYKTPDAIKLALEAVRRDPQAYTLDTLAWCYYRAGRFRDACDIQKRALRALNAERPFEISNPESGGMSYILRPDDGGRSYYYHLAAIYAAMGEKANALVALEVALHNDADFEDYESAINLRNQICLKDDIR